MLFCLLMPIKLNSKANLFLFSENWSYASCMLHTKCPSLSAPHLTPDYPREADLPLVKWMTSKQFWSSLWINHKNWLLNPVVNHIIWSISRKFEFKRSTFPRIEIMPNCIILLMSIKMSFKYSDGLHWWPILQFFDC